MWSQDLGVTIGGAIGIDTISSILGLLVGHHASLPTGPTIITIAGIIFVFSVLFGRQNGLIQRLRHPAHLNG